MLTITGQDGEQFCDGISRRSFLKIGSLGLGGCALPEILQAQGNSSGGSSHKSVIMIFLPGGPPHQDMFDLKMDAPSEIRGEFKPISTAVPGIQICELFPRMAKMAKKLTFVRSIVGAVDSHWSLQCLSGRSPRDKIAGGWPSMGSVLSKLEGPTSLGIPPFVGLAPTMGHVPWADPGKPGFLGPAHGPFNPNGAGKGDMTLNGVSLDRLRDRRSLLAGFDRFRTAVDQGSTLTSMDRFTEQAFGILTSSRLAKALDIESEAPELRNRYGRGSAKLQADGGPKLLDQFLLARRLVEAGVRCVTLAFSRWDWHGNNFGRAREDFPMLDQGVTALVEDLHQRGMDKDVSVVVWGEFGRTPKINPQGGRDHWPRVSCALLACGGMKMGQVIGSTDRLGGEAEDRPVHFQEVFSTLYHNLGIDTASVTVPDLSGRPRYLVDPQYRPMPELV
jgi:hypothetical protein